MSTESANGIPIPFPTGIETDEYWAYALGMKAETFRDQCREMSVPFEIHGNRMLVDAKDWHQARRAHNAAKKKSKRPKGKR